MSAVAIAKEGEAVELVKEGDKWKVGGTKSFYLSESDLAALKTAVDNLGKAELEVVSGSRDRQGDFEATASSGAAVVLKQGDSVLRELVVGKAGNDWSSNYVTVADRDETFLVKADLSALSRTDWYDRTVFAVDQSKIAKVRFQYGSTGFTVEKSGEEWQGISPRAFTVDPDKIGAIVEALAALNASEVPAQTFAGTGLEKNRMIIQFTGVGFDHTLMVGDAQDPEAENKLYFAKRGDSDNIYLISESDRDKLETSMTGLR
jgi:hypothetical protein